MIVAENIESQLLLLDPEDIASGWVVGDEPAYPKGHRVFVSSGRIGSPDLDMVAWDEDADVMVWDKMDPAMGKFSAKFQSNGGVMTGLPPRMSAFGVGLVSDIYFDC